MHTLEFDLPQAELEAIEKKIHKFNKYSKKLNVEPLELEVVNVWVKPEARNKLTNELFKPATSMAHIKLSNTQICIKGWTFKAIVESLGNEVVTRGIPGFVTPKSFREVWNYCDHCKKIRSRKYSFIIQHEDGTLKQVGSTCLKDFLGHNFTLAYTTIEGIIDDIQEARSRNSGPTHYSTHSIILSAKVFIDLYGWTSKGDERDDPGKVSTATNVMDLIAPDRVKTFGQAKVDRLELASKDEKRIQFATGCLEWAKTLDSEHPYEYLRNLGIVARAEFVNHKYIGMAASTVTAYQRYLDEQEVANRIKNKKPSEFVGTVGKRRTFKVKCRKVIVLANKGYGCSGLHIFEDENNNELIWFASASCNVWIDESEDWVEIKATVKDHSTNTKEIKQTVINRVKEVQANELPLLQS